MFPQGPQGQSEVLGLRLYSWIDMQSRTRASVGNKHALNSFIMRGWASDWVLSEESLRYRLTCDLGDKFKLLVFQYFVLFFFFCFLIQPTYYCCLRELFLFGINRWVNELSFLHQTIEQEKDFFVSIHIPCSYSLFNFCSISTGEISWGVENWRGHS